MSLGSKHTIRMTTTWNSWEISRRHFQITRKSSSLGPLFKAAILQESIFGAVQGKIRSPLSFSTPPFTQGNGLLRWYVNFIQGYCSADLTCLKVNEYFAYQLITNYGKNATFTKWVDSYDWYIIPVVNPDGFVYTQTTDRNWRKNRQK